MEDLIVHHGGREGKGSLGHNRRMIQRKQVKQAYGEFRLNENRNENSPVEPKYVC